MSDCPRCGHETYFSTVETLLGDPVKAGPRCPYCDLQYGPEAMDEYVGTAAPKEVTP